MSNQLSRRNAGVLLFIFVFSLALASTGAQCTRSSDTVLAPGSLSEASDYATMGSCWQECAQDANESRSAERDRFVEAIQNCEPGTDCRAREAALHVSIMQEIAADSRECMASCHNQGHGSGGQ